MEGHMSQVVRLVAALGTTITLFASAGAADTKATKDQVLAIYTGNTHYIKSPTNEWAAFFKPDGSARGRAWWSGGEEFGNGKWHVTDGGSVCIGWDNKHWAKGNENCWDVYANGDTLKVVHVSGDGANDATVIVKKGNPYNL
jgi:hypothetical protein